ncbi:MAG: hypothetical protein Kow0090_00700 [Myxococcota bacterium]
MEKRAIITAVLGFLVFNACSSGITPGGNKVGEECVMTNDCDEGLVCYTGESYREGYCTIMCDPTQLSGNESIDCKNHLDSNKIPTRCASGKPEENLGLCRPTCQDDSECKRENYRCYGYTHPLVSTFKGRYCAQGGKVGAMCVRDKDCALDLTCYRDQTWECSVNEECPRSQVCDGEYCSRVPEGFCTKQCRTLSSDINDSLWSEIIPYWNDLTEQEKMDKVVKYAGQSPDCPEGSECGPSGLCRPSCMNNEFCYQNRYDLPCELDKDCEPAGFCPDQETVLSGITITPGVCAPNCAKDNTCAALDYECRSYQEVKFCLPITHCETNADCRTGESCDKTNRAFLCNEQ